MWRRSNTPIAGPLLAVDYGLRIVPVPFAMSCAASSALIRFARSA